MNEYVFEFTRVDTFFDDINRKGKFDTRDMDGINKNYKMVLISDCPNDVNECIDEDGTINTDNCQIIDTSGTYDGYCSLLWSEGVNGERTIGIVDSTIVYDLGDKTSELKAVFLVNMVDGSGYVLAYAINSYSFPIDGEIILPCDGMLWSIRYEG